LHLDRTADLHIDLDQIAHVNPRETAQIRADRQDLICSAVRAIYHPNHQNGQAWFNIAQDWVPQSRVYKFEGTS
jgi:hypothetical protein